MVFFLGIALWATTYFAEKQWSHQRPKSPEYYALGPFRGMVCSYRWMEVSRQQSQFHYEEVNVLGKEICNLQPYVEESWNYLAWNMAFNLFIEAGESEEIQWTWLSRGIDHYDEGLQWNPQSKLLKLEKVLTIHLRSEGRPAMLKHLNERYGDAIAYAAGLIKELNLGQKGEYVDIQWAIVVLRRAHFYDDAIETCSAAIQRFPNSRERFGEIRDILEKEKLESCRK